MREHWRRNGPPLNIAAVAIAASLGVDLIDREKGEAGSVAEADGVAGPSITELAQLMAVLPGHDTREASRLIAERWGGAGDGG